MIKKFTKEQANQFTFYRMPKELFTNPKYKKSSDGAKILYGLLLNRNSLSLQNGWFDEQGYVYIYFSREEAMQLLGTTKTTIAKLFAELKEVELVEEVRQGQGKPNIIYVGDFATGNTCKSSEVQELDFLKSRN